MSSISGELLHEHAGIGVLQAGRNRIVIRRATQFDEDAARLLFAVRRQAEEATSSDAKGPDLTNPARAVWLAFDGDRAVGMTSVQERQLRSGDEELRIAYWTGLFIDPSYRSFFIYPRLISAMYVGLREIGIHRLYAAVRRQQIAQAHLKIGFTKIGDMTVLAKPLRPALLFAKYKKFIRRDGDQRFLRALCSVPDAVVGMGIRFQGLNAGAPWEVSEAPWGSDEIADLARLYEQAHVGQTTQTWNVELLRARYAGEGSDYRLLAVRHQDRLLAAAIVRMVERSEGIRAAVIMDLIHEPNSDRAAKMALAGVERLALASGCEGVLLLDGLSSDDARLVKSRAYLKSPEKYSLLMWTDRGMDPLCLPQDLRSWRFGFGDHDTF
ncbi:MAG: GNAT family N-acetyltransferase [Nitrospira sp.]|nr:MAG: GNAT family N-acetyltransferase [Nitrospira sp.]